MTNLKNLSRPQLQVVAAALAEAKKRGVEIDIDDSPPVFNSWELWLKTIFPSYVTASFGARHIAFWQWVEDVTPGSKPRAFVALWPRGGAKSTSAELACVRFGYKKTRQYVWYVSSTQDKADKHVETIGAMLESANVEKYYPALASRKVGKYGHSKGWRRNRLRTQSGFTIDALGLDVGTRGSKVEDKRPDLIIFDDVDEKQDTPKTTQKRIDLITTSILPAGSSDCAVLFIQNVIHENSIAAQLADGRAEFMIDRVVSGPFPAIDDLAYETRFDDTLNRNRYFITAGTPTWEGQSIEICQSQINEWGLTAFLQESQHEVENSGGIWDHIEFQHIERENVPDIVRGCVWCDPAVTSNDDSCANGIQADGLGEDHKVYRFYSWEQVAGPRDVIEKAIRTAIEYGFGVVGVETNQGGDTWQTTFDYVLQDIKDEYREEFNASFEAEWKRQNPTGGSKKEEFRQRWIDKRMARVGFPRFAGAKAGTGTGGKVERNQKMLASYERGEVVHVIGTHAIIEKALRRFPNEPLDLADAAYWSWADLQEGYVTFTDDPFY